MNATVKREVMKSAEYPLRRRVARLIDALNALDSVLGTITDMEWPDGIDEPLLSCKTYLMGTGVSQDACRLIEGAGLTPALEVGANSVILWSVYASVKPKADPLLRACGFKPKP